MKISSYVVDGRTSYGVIDEGGIADIGLSAGPTHSLRKALEGHRLADLAQSALERSARLDPRGVTWLPVIPCPNKIACAGINYRTHASETGRAVPEAPSIFTRHPDTLVAHQAPLRLPRVSGAFDFEGELAVIIGRGGRYIDPADALRHVAGYACFNDGSVRDYQKHSVTAGKNFPGTGALGPWMVTPDEVPDPTALTLVTRVNGREMQRASVGEMIHDIPALIAFVSQFTPLNPGDVIATGTPEGVGHRRTPPSWLKARDVVEVEISGIGTLSNVVEADA